MDKANKHNGIPPKLKAVLEVWSDEIEQQILASSSAFTFLTKLDAYNEIFEQQDESQKALNVGVYFASVEKLIIDTVAEDVPKLAQIFRSKTRRIQTVSQTQPNEQKQLHEKAVKLLLSLPKRLLKNIDNSEKLLQSKVVTDRGISPFKKLLRQLFENANEEVWAELSPQQINQLELRLKSVKERQAEQLLGLDEGKKITVSRVNKFLEAQADEELSDDKKEQIATLVQMFRNAGHRLLLDDRECAMQCKYSSDRGHRRFVFIEPNKGGRVFSARNRLPSGLRFEK